MLVRFIPLAIRKRYLLPFTALLIATSGSAQWVPSDLRDSTNQADYVIITPSEYEPIVRPLASLRASHDGYTVIIALTDSIYQNFGQGITPDSAIKSFIQFADHQWGPPHPRYILLAGNINTVPSHKIPGLDLSPVFFDDSVMYDDWFVEDLNDTLPPGYPGAAIGRFPAWTPGQLRDVVSKTLSYEALDDAPWSARAIVVADSEASPLFEIGGFQITAALETVWPETTSVHVRQGSALYREKQEFISDFNAGAAIISFVGHSTPTEFSQTSYFTTWDVDSLTNEVKLPFCLLYNQRFELRDTLPLSVNLVLLPAGGAVACLAATGVAYYFQSIPFHEELFRQMTADPTQPIGRSILNAKVATGPGLSSGRWKEALMGDPALVIRFPGIVADGPPPNRLPGEFVLSQNYPNPFNPTTRIEFSIPQALFTRLEIFNVAGERIATLASGTYPPGVHSLEWDARGVPSGVYFYRLRSGDFSQTRKLILLR